MGEVTSRHTWVCVCAQTGQIPSPHYALALRSCLGSETNLARFRERIPEGSNVFVWYGKHAQVELHGVLDSQSWLH
jgi:hypothetical protein